MQYIKFSLILLIASALFTFASCDKDDPIDPNNNGADTVFTFTAKINDVAWDGANAAAANAYITAFFPDVQSLPVATFTNDTLLMGVGGLYKGYQATMLMGLKPPNKSNLVGSYQFATTIPTMKPNEAIALFDGAGSDFLTYAAGITFLEFDDNANLTITKHKDNRISGTFNYSIVNPATSQTVHKVTEGKFTNFKIK